MVIRLPDPDLQVTFAERLISSRARVLQPALLSAVVGVGADAIDAEVAKLVPARARTLLAGCGLRAELVFAVPVLLKHNPRLIGYYRLLLGFSQKAFYTRETNLAPFKCMEDAGAFPPKHEAQLHALCRRLIHAGEYLLDRVDTRQLTAGLLSDLTLLTLGAQLRGGANNAIGNAGATQVFAAIRQIIGRHVVKEDERTLHVVNAAKREVTIEFASDPDIIIRELLATGTSRNIIAVEIKGGRDCSNIHNRVGEAEKSHQKARKRGFVECWTIINVSTFKETDLRRESPSTDRFFTLTKIVSGRGAEFADFRSRLMSLTGIPEV